MFRHPNFKHIKGTKNDFSFEKRIDQSIRYFKIPVLKEKEDVLNILFDRINAKEQFKKKTNNVVKFYYSIASVAAVFIVFFSLYFFFSFETIKGEQNASNVFYLPDNSRVILTEGAKLKYSKLFYNRHVKLKGEAYFEAEHQNENGFYVKTLNGGVLVLGTRFSVSDLNHTLIVQCYQGVVGVDYGSEKIRISEGNMFKGVSNSIAVVDNKIKGYPNYAIFNYSCQNKKLHEIWPFIEDYFGLKIYDKSNIQKAFTGSINTGNAHEVIDIICTSMELQFILEDNKEVIIERKQ